MSELQGYTNAIGLPEGVTYSDGIFRIASNKESSHCGFELENLIKIDNLNNGTQSNFCLENIGSDFLIKSGIPYIDVDDTGLDKYYNVQYELSTTGDKTCKLISANDKHMKKYPTFNEDSIVRTPTGELYKIVTIFNEAFIDFQVLELENLPKSITMIGKNAFLNNLKLNLRKLPPKLELLATGAFEGCLMNDIKKLPGSLKTYGARCFFNNPSMEIIDATELNPSTTINTDAFGGTTKCTLNITNSIATAWNLKEGDNMQGATIHIVTELDNIKYDVESLIPGYRAITGLPYWITVDEYNHRMTIGTPETKGDLEVQGRMKFDINANLLLQENVVIKAGETQISPSTGLPDGLDYTDGIFTVNKNEITGNCGLNIDNVFRVDNKDDGTIGNALLETPTGEYKVKIAEEKKLHSNILYIINNNKDSHNVEYFLNNKVGTATIITKKLPKGYIKPENILDKKTDRLYKVI